MTFLPGQPAANIPIEVGKMAVAPAVEVQQQPDAPPVGGWESVVFTATAYDAPCEICCAGANDGITASRYDVRTGVLSHFLAAPTNIPIGTVICVPGYNSGRPSVVLDRMPGEGNTLGVYIREGHHAARKWGRRTLTVQIWRLK